MLHSALDHWLLFQARRGPANAEKYFRAHGVSSAGVQLTPQRCSVLGTCQHHSARLLEEAEWRLFTVGGGCVEDDGRIAADSR